MQNIFLRSILFPKAFWISAGRTPAKYTMTFPKGYNASSLKQDNLTIKRAVPENYDFGTIEIESPSGNPIRVYDLERTLCDILRGSGSDVQVVGEAMKRYAASKDKNIHKLMKCADQLRLSKKLSALPPNFCGTTEPTSKQ